jgi:hypothetical protein
MDQALAVPIIAGILLILMAQLLNSSIVVLAKGFKSSENPTLSECGQVAKGGHPIALTFIAACILLYPHHFKKGGGDTLVPIPSDSTEGVEPFTFIK